MSKFLSFTQLTPSLSEIYREHILTKKNPVIFERLGDKSLYDPTIPLLGICIQKTWKQGFEEMLLHSIKSQEVGTTQCPSMDGQTKRGLSMQWHVIQP